MSHSMCCVSYDPHWSPAKSCLFSLMTTTTRRNRISKERRRRRRRRESAVISQLVKDDERSGRALICRPLFRRENEVANGLAGERERERHGEVSSPLTTTRSVPSRKRSGGPCLLQGVVQMNEALPCVCPCVYLTKSTFEREILRLRKGEDWNKRGGGEGGWMD